MKSAIIMPLIFVLGFQSWAQTTQTGPTLKSPLTDIIPPSPNASSIGKYGSNPIGLHTGTVQFSIPMFNFSVGNFQIPISISYGSNGVKIDEVAGRVGTQWKMDFAGVINRTIMGVPDETCQGQYKLNIHDTSSYEFYDFLKRATESTCGIYQPDQFSYAFPGYSGKFILSGDSIVQIPYNNVKITKSLFGFQVITPDGTKYIFGEGADEINREVPFTGNVQNCTTETYTAPGITTWYLRKIILTNGQEIEYVYNYRVIDHCIGYLTGINQTNTFMRYGQANPQAHYDPASFGVQTCVQQMEYGVVRLDAIKASNGEVKFSYSGREDLEGDYKLDSVRLITKSGKVIKKFGLNYEYSNAGSQMFDTYLIGNQSLQDQYPSLRKRLFLTSVFQMGKMDTIRHKFDYIHKDSLPPRLSFSQDYWGYFNGQVNKYFFPAYVSGSAYNPNGVEEGGDREGRFEYSQMGMLKRITYPTGGFTEYSYEPCSKEVSWRPNYDTLIFSGTTSQFSGPFETIVHLENQSCALKIKIESTANPMTPPPPGSPEFVLADTILTVELVDQSKLSSDSLFFRNNGSIWETYIFNRVGDYFSGGIPLKLRIKSNYDSDVQYKVTFYNPKKEPVDFIPSGRGVRVSEVIDHDLIGKYQNKRHFKYELNKVPESVDYEYMVQAPQKEWIFNSAENGYNWLQVKLHSSSNQSLFNNDFNSFSYSKVIEEFIDSKSILQGGIEYRFLNIGKKRPDRLSAVKCGWNFAGLDGNPFAPIPEIGSFNCMPIPGESGFNTHLHDGKELERTTFIMENGNIKRVKNITRNFFGIDPGTSFIDTLYNLKKIGSPGTTPLFKYYSIFSIGLYTIQSNWMRLDSTESVSFENQTDSLKTVTRLYYGDYRNMQPSQIHTTLSNNQIVQSSYKYPLDFKGDPVFDSLIVRNMISSLIEETGENLSTGIENSRSRINFTGFHNNKLFLPSSIEKSTKEQPFIKEATIELYDTLGNVLQFVGKDGLINSIIWGYDSQYPVAKIVGLGYQTAISASGINLDVLNNSNSTESEIITELNKLRTVPNSMVTTYTYEPLMGVTSETDTNGKSVYYVYDSLGRLNHIKDHSGNIVKMFCYNYAGEVMNCNGD